MLAKHTCAKSSGGEWGTAPILGSPMRRTRSSTLRFDALSNLIGEEGEGGDDLLAGW